MHQVGYRPIPWTRDKIKSQILDVFEDGEVSNYSQYDSLSIMKYVLNLDVSIFISNSCGIAVTSCLRK